MMLKHIILLEKITQWPSRNFFLNPLCLILDGVPSGVYLVVLVYAVCEGVSSSTRRRRAIAMNTIRAKHTTASVPRSSSHG
jgi:hypothetical protein